VRRSATALAALLLVAGTTSCGGKESDAAPEPTDTLATAAPSSTAPSSSAPANPLTASQVVTALKAGGRTCANELSYVICTSGPVQVWVLTGDHPRPPVLSLNATGSPDAARKAIADQLVPALTAAHVSEVAAVNTWYTAQTADSASTTVGDWKVELSTEQDSDVPGVHLTLNDTRCKSNCEAE
jgi:hypothetical protein